MSGSRASIIRPAAACVRTGAHSKTPGTRSANKHTGAALDYILTNVTTKTVAGHSAPGLDATAQGSGNGTQIEQWTYTGGNNQRWTVTHLGGGQYRIIGVQSGRCVEVGGWATANGSKVQ